MKYISFEKFFCYFAIQQRFMINKKALDVISISNIHPLEIYRTNIPLSRIEIFREIYNVQKNNNMWWKNNNLIWK